MTKFMKCFNIRKLIVKCHRRLRCNDNSDGFSLVELLVVIAIMVILVALLTPNIMGYVKKAKRTAALADAKNMLNGAQTALIYESRYGAFQVDKKITVGKQTIMCAGVSNTAMKNAIYGGNVTNKADTNTASAIVEMLAAMAIDPGKNAKSGSYYKPFGLTGEEFLKRIDSEYGVLLLYQKNGGVIFMQVYHDGILVTYANGYWVANDKKDAKFISLGQTFDKPFSDAGMTKSEIGYGLEKTKMPSSW